MFILNCLNIYLVMYIIFTGIYLFLAKSRNPYNNWDCSFTKYLCFKGKIIGTLTILSIPIYVPIILLVMMIRKIKRK